MSVSYEWDVETYDLDATYLGRDPDILDHDHSETLSWFIPELNINQRLVLVRDEVDCCGSLLDRGWAYVHKGLLSTHFYDSYEIEMQAVPKRFKIELDNKLLSMPNFLNLSNTGMG